MNPSTALIVKPQDPCNYCVKPIEPSSINMPLCGHRFHRNCFDRITHLFPDCPACNLNGVNNLVARSRYKIAPSFSTFVSDIQKEIAQINNEKDLNTKQLRALDLTMRVTEKLLNLAIKGDLRLNVYTIAALGVAYNSLGMCKFYMEHLK